MPKTYILLRYLPYTSFFFRRIQFKPSNQIFFISIKIYRMLKKLKSKDTANFLSKAFLIAFSLVIYTTLSQHGLTDQNEYLVVYDRLQNWKFRFYSQSIKFSTSRGLDYLIFLKNNFQTTMTPYKLCNFYCTLLPYRSPL